MTRSPLAYPLNRAADTDVGGAADLQTDIMRFMAILSLCLVAIFALVQSIPLAPIEPVDGGLPATEPAAEGSASPEPAPQTVESDLPATEPAPVGGGSAATELEKPVVLTRPTWEPKFPKPAEAKVASRPAPTAREPVASEPSQAIPEPVASEVAPVEPEQEGFTLRFASNTALTRAVAAHQVGLYAITAGAAKRMAVSDSRLSFWDASTPNAFHEMESSTVPAPVVQALARTGVETAAVNWGVTLPGKMTRQVENLMQQHSGGTLIIAASGEIHWEASQ
jgi:hypothetical protein